MSARRFRIMKAPPYRASWSWSGAGAVVGFCRGRFRDLARRTGAGAALQIPEENERVFRGHAKDALGIRSWCPRKLFYRFDERWATAVETPRRIPSRRRGKMAPAGRNQSRSTHMSEGRRVLRRSGAAEAHFPGTVRRTDRRRKTSPRSGFGGCGCGLPGPPDLLVWAAGMRRRPTMRTIRVGAGTAKCMLC
jgi:hypothetical protein